MKSSLEQICPRKAYFKTGKTTNMTVLKRELIPYSSTEGVSITVGNQQRKTVRFLISASDGMLDTKASYFSLKLKTNTYTSILSSDITALIKKITVKLPANANIVLAEIDNYNTLNAAIKMMSMNPLQLESSWHDGSNMLVDMHNNDQKKRHRKFLNLQHGGYHSFAFQLNLCPILSLEQYFPLSLTSLLIELELSTPNEAFAYDPALEAIPAVFDNVAEFYLTAEQYNALPDNEDRAAVVRQLTEFYDRPIPANQPLQYQIRDFIFHGSIEYMNNEYMKKLHAKAATKNGLSIFFDSYRFNRIDNHGSSTIHSQLANQYQNLKSFQYKQTQ